MDESAPCRPSKTKKRKIVTKVATTPINLELKFEDLGGLEEQINLIQEEVIYCHKNSAALKRSGLEHTVGGVLLEGPPGTGKTICAHTIAAELVRQTGRNYSFFTHNAADCLSKWIGESEKAIRDLFEAAALSKPSIIFFDEFDAICPRRDHEKSSQEHRTLVATILSEFNKIKEHEILIIATTNLVTNIDPAMLRDGRFDFTINFPLPNERQRQKIITIKMNNFIVADEVIEYVAKQTAGCSGSALTLLCTRAQRNAFKRQRSKLKNEVLKFVDKMDFLEVLKTNRRLSNQQANVGSDSIFHVICTSLVNRVEPYTLFDKHFIGDAISKVFTNCFLIWSQDSNLILNTIIVPNVLEGLKLPVYTVNQDILDSTVENFETIPVRTFKGIVNRAVTSGKPGILFVENIDALGISDDTLVNSLLYTGQHAIFVLATSSTEPSKLPNQLNRLFKPCGLERSYKLPPPTDHEIRDLFHSVIVSTVQQKLRKKLNQKTMNNLFGRFQASMQEKSYDALSAALSEIRVQCQISSTDNLINDLEILFSP